MFAAERYLSGRKVTVIGAIMKAPNLDTALADSRSVLQSAFAGFDTIEVVKKGTLVAKYTTKWGSTASAVANKDLAVFGWKATNPTIAVDTPQLKTPRNQSSVGSMSAKTSIENQTIELELDQNLIAPSVKWRLEHLF